MKHSIVTITPQMAQLMLESNTNNRKLDDTTVAQYAKDMTSGAWKINGETIKFSSTGKLLDGQHRLHGCVRSGKDLVTMMVEGLDEDVFTTIDMGKKRKTSQILAIAGYTNTYRLAAIVRYIYLTERKLLRPNIGGHHSITAQQTLEWLEAHTFVIEAAKEGDRLQRSGFNRSSAGAAYYLMYLRDSDLAHKYFVQLFSGENLKNGDPALAVRNAIMRNKNTALEQLAILIRGWNALRADKQMFEARAFFKNKSGEYNSVEIE